MTVLQNLHHCDSAKQGMNLPHVPAVK